MTAPGSSGRTHRTRNQGSDPTDASGLTGAGTAGSAGPAGGGPGGSGDATPAAGPGGPVQPERQPPASDCDDSELLAALLDGMDAALCALDADGVVTHWNREAERILGWPADEAVGRRGLAGWVVRTADAEEVEGRLLAAMHSGRQVHEFALMKKDGGRVLVRVQSAAVRRAGGRPAGVYCAFSEVHAQIDLERSIGLSEALFEDAPWGVVLVDADLRPALANDAAARALRTGRTTVLGRPLGDLLSGGVEDLESALQHVLAEGAPPAPADLWVTLRAPDGRGESERRCWRNGFVRLKSPLAEEPVPLGVGWFFQDVTDAKQLEQDGSVLRFRANQLHRAARTAADCEDPSEAATVFLDFALAGFADHALLDLTAPSSNSAAAPAAGGATAPGAPAGPEASADSDVSGVSGTSYDEPVRLVRAAATPAGSKGPCSKIQRAGLPVRYVEGHPALQAVERTGPVRASAALRPPESRPRESRGGDSTGGSGYHPSGSGYGSAAGYGPGSAADSVAEQTRQWARARQWPEDSVHALCVVLRSRGRTLGVVTFLRSAGRRPFDRADAEYAEDIAGRVASALDLADHLS